MPSEIEIHHPAVQTHIPGHEEAARERRAAVVGLPPAPDPPPPAPTNLRGNRKTWHVDWPTPNPRP